MLRGFSAIGGRVLFERSFIRAGGGWVAGGEMGRVVVAGVFRFAFGRAGSVFGFVLRGRSCGAVGGGGGSGDCWREGGREGGSSRWVSSSSWLEGVLKLCVGGGGGRRRWRGVEDWD